MHHTHPSQWTGLYNLVFNIVCLIHEQVHYHAQSVNMNLVLYNAQIFIGQFIRNPRKPMNNVLFVLTSASECVNVALFQYSMYFIANISQSYPYQQLYHMRLDIHKFGHLQMHVHAMCMEGFISSL